TSFDGTATFDIVVTITGTNDNATITVSASDDTPALEVAGVHTSTPGVPSASGQLTVHDVDSGQAHFQTPASLAGTYGTYSFNPRSEERRLGKEQRSRGPPTARKASQDNLSMTPFHGTARFDLAPTNTGTE